MGTKDALLSQLSLRGDHASVDVLIMPSPGLTWGGEHLCPTVWHDKLEFCAILIRHTSACMGLCVSFGGPAALFSSQPIRRLAGQLVGGSGQVDLRELFFPSGLAVQHLKGSPVLQAPSTFGCLTVHSLFLDFLYMLLMFVL